MRTEVALQLGLCALCLTLTLLGEGMGVELPDPPAVDCVWSDWTVWSACDPCTKTRRRSRGIEVFGQFLGMPCQKPLGERESCVTDVNCAEPPLRACTDTEFQCESGTCIKKRLMCNGDFDCEDGSDEDCETGRKPCGTRVLENNEQGRTAGYGINILGAEPRMNPFNNDFFNGKCSQLRNPNTLRYDRLPWNVDVLRYETLVEETVNKEIYEDTHSILRKMLTEVSTNIEAGFSFKFEPTEPPLSNVSLSVGGSANFEKKTMIKEMAEYTESSIKNKIYMRVQGKVQMSTYRLRSRELKVADEFLLHVKSLPLQYEKGIYFAFLEDYGTHYTKNGKSGGEYELVYVLNKDVMTTKSVSETTVHDCFQANLKTDISFTGVQVNPHIAGGGCTDVTNNNQDDDHSNAVVDRVMTSVKGGTLESAAAMKANLDKDIKMDLTTYQGWARTIADAPALIHSEPEPIYMLVPLDMPGANTRISNLKKATADYVAEYNVCKCKPCHNGGTLALLDGRCICLCPLLFEGLGCQKFKGDKARINGTRPSVDQEGNWSCWSSWSGCSGGKHNRTRGCNTAGVLNANCRGATTSEEYC